MSAERIDPDNLKNGFPETLYLILTVLLPSGAVYAQSPDVYIREQDGTRGKTFDVKIRASAGQTYDDNITYAENNRTTDFITSITPGVTASYEGRRTQAELNVDVPQQIYWETPDNSNNSQIARIDVRHELSEFDTVSVSDAFTHVHEPVSFDEEFSRVGGRYSSFRNSADLTYAKEFVKRFRAKAGYGYDIDVTDRSDLLDSYVNRGSLEGSLATTSKSVVVAGYDFLQRTLEPGGSANISTVSTGVGYKITEQVNVQCTAGADLIDSYNGEFLVRPLWVAKLTDQITDATSADISYTQRHSTNPYTSDVFSSWRASTEVKSQLLRRLKGSVSAFYGRGEYNSLKIEDDLLGGKVALTYEITKHIDGVVSYSYSQTTSSIDLREYRKNVVYVGLSSMF